MSQHTESRTTPPDAGRSASLSTSARGGDDIDVRGLTRSFGDIRAVDGVDFTVTGGLLTGFVGGNGAGKTTTMRMIMGVLSPTAGEVLWRGRPVTALDRREFGYMPEERGLYPDQAVLDQLVYLGRLRGLTASAAKASVTEHLERLGLGERAKEKVQKLSLGNQQRVQIIAALMGRPQALVLDEPFSGLDPAAVDNMVDLLREHTSRGVPVLFSSHQLDLVERLCERLVVLARGKVVAAGTSDELRSTSVVRHRLVLSGDAGWVRGVPGIHVVDVDGPTAVVELVDERASRSLLSAALERGDVLDFAQQRPSLAQIYREVTA
ncbi:ABC transporter ATP-binding protein [Terracoccus luteus]|uniref:ABC-2 type transport system ATP-binding protein n=1 Tax=Terracoccus luteus TaxID=53356 RepID=A0A839PZG9_9MICO|nr:ATP-binding cassette domain-containing protein [Terracoccus luteus]MBB2988104.1 ABC-2 type transport system ATP-binding protein [Terracoccus luteus]MCP2173755.1 ABC-2 type transport system ATP-binding protein [Terracoccus luteus]